MKVRIINTKENPVIIKSDKKPPFVDRPSFANGSLLFAPYKQGYTTPGALYKLLDDIKQDGKSYLDEIDVFGDNLDYFVWIYTSDWRYTPEFVDEVYFKLDPFSKIYVESRGNFENSCVLGVRGVLLSFSDDFFNGSKTIYMPIQTDGIIAPGCISLNTKQTDIVDEDIQEVIKMLELSCTV